MYRQVPSELPFLCNLPAPSPRIFMSEKFGPSACAKRGCYHLPLPCIPPPGLFYCSSTEEGGRALTVLYGTCTYIRMYMYIHVPHTYMYMQEVCVKNKAVHDVMFTQLLHYMHNTMHVLFQSVVIV